MEIQYFQKIQYFRFSERIYVEKKLISIQLQSKMGNFCQNPQLLCRDQKIRGHIQVKQIVTEIDQIQEQNSFDNILSIKEQNSLQKKINLTNIKLKQGIKKDLNQLTLKKSQFSLKKQKDQDKIVTMNFQNKQNCKLVSLQNSQFGQNLQKYQSRMVILNENQQQQQSSKIQKNISNQKIKIDVNWVSFIRLNKKNFNIDYQIQAQLGKGAFGTVYKVKMKTSGLLRAMKSIKKTSLIKQDQKRVFVEMGILKDLDHPNILKLFQIYQWKNTYYLVSELCEGGQLFQQIQNRNQFSQKNAIQIMRNLLSALYYMHKSNIVHRDLKPQNLMFLIKNDLDSLKIIDFGTSKKIRSKQKLKKIVGTYYYMAPEVFDHSYDQKCDVWSCGVIMYVLLCGYFPFKGKNETQLISNIKHETVKFHYNSWKNISDEAKILINKMLCKDPNIRISAEQALNSVWLKHEKIHYQNLLISVQNLKNFYFKNRLKAVVLTYIASQLYTNMQKMQMQKIFKQIDTDGDGFIQTQELLSTFYEYYPTYKVTDIENILKIVDINSSGKIDFTQFIVAASTQQQLLQTNRIQNAFHYFDVDQSGFITLSQLKMFLNEHQVKNIGIQNLFCEVDINHDGRICLQEFKQLLINKKN